MARHVWWLDWRREAFLVLRKPDLKNPTNPRKRAAVSEEGAKGRVDPTETMRRAEGKHKRTTREGANTVLRRGGRPKN